MKKLLIVLGICVSIAHGQAARFGDQNPTQTTVIVPGVSGQLVKVVPTAIIQFCAWPANAVPCTNKVTTYTDITLTTPCATSTQVVLSGTSNCVGTSDALGNWGVWVPPGTYQYTFTYNGNNYGPFYALPVGATVATVNCPAAINGAIGAMNSPTAFNCDPSLLTDFAGNLTGQSAQFLGPVNGFTTYIGGGSAPGTLVKFKLPANAFRIAAPATVGTPYYFVPPATRCTAGQVWGLATETTDANGDKVDAYQCQNAGLAAGSNGQIQFNSSNAFAGSASTITSAGSLSIPSAQTLNWNADTYLSRGGSGLFYVGVSAGDNTGQLWTGATQHGIDGISSPGTFQFWPGSGVQVFNTMLNVVQHPTTNPGVNVGSAPILAQNISDPSTNSTTNYYAAGAFYNSVPATNSSNFFILDGGYFEVRTRGSGTVGSTVSTGIYGVDAEVFPDGSTAVGNGGARGVYGHFGNFSSGTINFGIGGEFQAENISGGGTITNAYGVQIDGPQVGSTGAITNYSALNMNCGTFTGVINGSCISVIGSYPNTLGGGLTTMDSANLNHAGGGSASAPLFTMGPDIHTGWYHPASSVWSFSANSTLGLEINFANGLFLHDGDNINFSSTTGSLDKDTSLSREAAAVLAVGDAANANAVNGTILAQDHATQLKATSALTAGQPVKADTGNASQVVVATTTDTAAGIVIGVVGNSPGAGGNAYVVTTGLLTTPLLGTGTCAISNFVIVDTTTNGRVKCTAVYTAGTVIGVALTAQAVIGSAVSVMVGLR